MKRFGLRCSSIPADCSRKRTGPRFPSMIGTSGALSSTIALSSRVPRKRTTGAPPWRRGLHPCRASSPTRVSPTFSACARMSIGSGKSVRRNTIPASGGAGRRVMRTFLPVCRPLPWHESNSSASVVRPCFDCLFRFYCGQDACGACSPRAKQFDACVSPFAAHDPPWGMALPDWHTPHAQEGAYRITGEKATPMMFRQASASVGLVSRLGGAECRDIQQSSGSASRPQSAPTARWR